ncbi:MAG: alginate export family protein [Deltaproteobacteria bacterium]|nr:alginate export family protein [Deltaproteobacteria bacterium]
MKVVKTLSLVIFLVFLFLVSIAGIVLSAEEKKRGILSSLKEIEIEKIKISLGGDARLRYEYKEDFDFDRNKNDRDGLWYFRSRLNLRISFNKNFVLFFEGLDAQEWDSDRSPKVQEDNFDFHQGYLKLSELWNMPLSLTIGRQKFQYGAKRLVGAPVWANKVRSFDALKLTYNPVSFDIDLFIANRVLYKVDQFNDANWGENFFGMYITYKGLKGQVFDLYSLNQIDNRHEVKGEDGKYGDLKRYTIGTRGEGKIPSSSLGYGYEFAYQFGDKASDNIKAFAYHLDVNYCFKELLFQPKVKIEYNFATGDDDPDDGDAKTFVPLFQTVHGPYGIIDFFRWQNVRHTGLTIDFVPVRGLKSSLQYHRFYLSESEAAWYNTRGKHFWNSKVVMPTFLLEIMLMTPVVPMMPIGFTCRRYLSFN